MTNCLVTGQGRNVTRQSEPFSDWGLVLALYKFIQVLRCRVGETLFSQQAGGKGDSLCSEQRYACGWVCEVVRPLGFSGRLLFNSPSHCGVCSLFCDAYVNKYAGKQTGDSMCYNNTVCILLLLLPFFLLQLQTHIWPASCITWCIFLKQCSISCRKTYTTCWLQCYITGRTYWMWLHNCYIAFTDTYIIFCATQQVTLWYYSNMATTPLRRR